METFESLYRALVGDVLLGQGLYFEHLTAIAQKSLDKGKIVLHDMKALGTVSGVPHQLDVIVVTPDKNRLEHIIECKDHSRAGSKVGLSEIRSFFAVAHDIRPDTATFVSATGFTRSAILFAKNTPYAPGKTLNLAVLHVEASTVEQVQWHERLISKAFVHLPQPHPFAGLLPEADFSLPIDELLFTPSLDIPNQFSGLQTKLISLEIGTKSIALRLDEENHSFSSDFLHFYDRGILSLIRIADVHGKRFIFMRFSSEFRASVIPITFKGRYRIVEDVKIALIFDFLATESATRRIAEKDVITLGRNMFTNPSLG